MPATINQIISYNAFFSPKNLEIRYYLLERERERERETHLASRTHNNLNNSKLANTLTAIFQTTHCRRIAFTAFLHACLYRIERIRVQWRYLCQIYFKI